MNETDYQDLAEVIDAAIEKLEGREDTLTVGDIRIRASLRVLRDELRRELGKMQHRERPLF